MYVQNLEFLNKICIYCNNIMCICYNNNTVIINNTLYLQSGIYR